jgi:sulfur relay (sulfurtransferase) DsrF/TusC family protein
MLDDLTPLQEAVLQVAADRHPEALDARAFAAALDASEGSLNVTLRSLQRRGLLAPRRARWALQAHALDEDGVVAGR